MNQILKSNKSSVEKALDGSILNIPESLLENPYIATTNNIKITVWSEFIDSKASIVGDLFIWAYHIRIDNKSPQIIKLLNRYWRVIDERGVKQKFSGEGVIGEQPSILPGKSYQYSSGIHLNYPSGIMTGRYQMQDGDGKIFDVKVPAFSLDVPSIESVIN